MGGVNNPPHVVHDFLEYDHGLAKDSGDLEVGCPAPCKSIH